MAFFLCRKCKELGKQECDCDNHYPFPSPYTADNVVEGGPAIMPADKQKEFAESIGREMDNDMRSWLNMLKGRRDGKKGTVEVIGRPILFSMCGPEYSFLDDALAEPFWRRRLAFYEQHGRPWNGPETDGDLPEVP